MRDMNLESVRVSFVKNVTDPTLNQLLDRLLANQYLNQEEMDTAKVKKGPGAAAFLIKNYCELDPKSKLCEELQKLKMNRDVATGQSD
uniref:CARD domain-containing protein n=1 Tax=Neogobius melanostomus TaxID=47308 RepID=A0A8C6WM74_9GOBI